ncbi:phosphotriesterase family protein [Streptomyces sp. SD15]
MSSVRTVLGDLLPRTLGVCDSHDHLFFGSPLLPGQELRDASGARAELAAFRERGGGSVVQWTPYGLGRRAADLPSISRDTGVHVVAATGLHQAARYPADSLTELRGRLTDVFVAELTEGIGTSGVRAGLIKVAGGFHALDDLPAALIRASFELLAESGPADFSWPRSRAASASAPRRPTGTSATGAISWPPSPRPPRVNSRTPSVPSRWTRVLLRWTGSPRPAEPMCGSRSSAGRGSASSTHRNWRTCGTSRWPTPGARSWTC